MDYLVKAVIFIPFMAIVYIVVDYFKQYLVDSMATIPYSGIFCQFGIYDGLSIFFTILISAFVAKQALNFAK